MPTELLVIPATATNEKLHLFSLYVDFSASAQARWAAGKIANMAAPYWETASEICTLDSVKSGRNVRHRTTDEAANADVIIVAASSLTHRQPVLIQWLDALAHCQTNRTFSGLLIGLLGNDETKTSELDWAVKPLIGCAQKAGRDFLWHWMGEDAMTEDEWLTENIENLLARKLAVSDIIPAI